MEKTYNVLYTYVPGPRPDPPKPEIEIELVTDCGDLSVGDKVIWYDTSKNQYLNLTYVGSSINFSLVDDFKNAFQFKVSKTGITSSINYVTITDEENKKKIGVRLSSPYDWSFTVPGTFAEALLMVTNTKGNTDNRIFANITTSYKYLPKDITSSLTKLNGSRVTTTSTTKSRWQLYKVIQQ